MFIFVCPKTNQQQSGEKDSRSLAVSLLSASGEFPVLLTKS
jgi:hypothetical protein